MDEPRAQRTLVKSPPELWAEVSDADALAAHLAEFGDIRITRSEPETTVAWEGDRARGTVQLEPTAWGTKVTLTAQVMDAPAAPAAVAQQEPEHEPEAVAEPEPEPVAEPVSAAAALVEPPPAPGFLARLFGRRRAAAVTPAATEPEPEPEPEPADAEPARDVPEPPPAEPAQAAADAAPLAADRAREVLGAVLDDLGSAHHRPFSR